MIDDFLAFHIAGLSHRGRQVIKAARCRCDAGVGSEACFRRKTGFAVWTHGATKSGHSLIQCVSVFEALRTEKVDLILTGSFNYSVIDPINKQRAFETNHW